jgi:hypothetical protein
MINAVAMMNRVPESEYFNGKSADGVDVRSSLSRLAERKRMLMQVCAPAREYIQHALFR